MVCSPQGFKSRLLGEGFHALIKGGLFSSPTNVGYYNPPPFGAQRPRSLALLPLIDVGLPPNSPPFGAQRPYWHIASSLPPFGEGREGWHIIWCLALIPFVITQIHRWQILSSLGLTFRASPQSFKTRLLGEDFYTLIKGGLFSPNQCGTSQKVTLKS